LRGGVGLNFSNEFLLQIAVYVASFGAVFGTFSTKLHYIEKKLDEHNNFGKRIIELEKTIEIIRERVSA
jgi:hypothetical protein